MKVAYTRRQAESFVDEQLIPRTSMLPNCIVWLLQWQQLHRGAVSALCCWQQWTVALKDVQLTASMSTTSQPDNSGQFL